MRYGSIGGNRSRRLLIAPQSKAPAPDSLAVQTRQMVPTLHSSSPPRKAGVQGSQRRRWPPPLQARGRLWVLAFAGMTERGEVPSANSQHSEVNERLSPQGRETWRWLFCCYLHQNISHASVLRCRFPGFSNSMRLRKQQRTWLFVAIPGCFRESRVGSGSQMHGGRRLPI